MSLNRLRLKWKVFFFLLGFCAILLVVLWLMQTVFLTDMYRYIRTRELRQVIAQVEKEIENPDLSALLYSIWVEKDITVAITRDFIIPIRTNFDAQGSGRANSQLNVITEVKEFTLSNGQQISLTFFAVIVPIQATVATLRHQLYIISCIMLVLAVTLAVVISKKVSKPIEDISQSALLLAKGDYDTHFEGKGFREIVSLSETLNTTAEQLGKVESLRRELLANVSHDLRTPLALIYSYAEMMSDFPEEITTDQTKMIMDEAKRLTSLVNDVLDISKLEADMGTLRCSVFCITKSISEIIERTNELLKSEGFFITFDFTAEVYVNADETKIGRAFYNLLTNAVNFSGDSRMVIVTQSVSNSNVRIQITDFGEGIAENELPFIWDKYYKSSKFHKRAVTGTGLGLTIVKTIIEQHNCGYGVISEIGKGSTFWFDLNIIHRNA